VGAGPPTKRSVRILKGQVAQIVGADIDPVVLDNTELDSAVLIENGKIPIENEFFDVVFADYVMEHVEDPKQLLCEIRRLLKPSGLFFFRTPNQYHYVALISRFTPFTFHKWIANPVRGLPPSAHDPWKTFYRFNSRVVITELAKDCLFTEVNLKYFEPEPTYLKFHTLPFLAGVAYERTVNGTVWLSKFRANIFGKLRK
jgi:SAM-dependent methyltransferase